MNLSVSRVTNCTPYELVFKQKPRAYNAILERLSGNRIVGEEELNINFEEISHSVVEDYCGDNESNSVSDVNIITDSIMDDNTRQIHEVHVYVGGLKSFACNSLAQDCNSLTKSWNNHKIRILSCNK